MASDEKVLILCKRNRSKKSYSIKTVQRSPIHMLPAQLLERFQSNGFASRQSWNSLGHCRGFVKRFLRPQTGKNFVAFHYKA